MIRLKGDWILAQLEPEKEETKAGLIRVGPEPIRIAKVVAKGPGRFNKRGKLIPMGVSLGDRFPFFKAVADTGTNEAVIHYLPEDHVLLRLSDVLFVMEEDIEVSL